MPSQPAGIAAIAEQTANTVVIIVASAVVLPRISAANSAKKVVIAFVPQKRKNRPPSIKIRLLLSEPESFCAFLAAFSAFLASFSAFALAAASAALFCALLTSSLLEGSLTQKRITSIPIIITIEPVRKT